MIDGRWRMIDDDDDDGYDVFSNHDADEYEYVTVLLTYDRIS